MTPALLLAGSGGIKAVGGIVQGVAAEHAGAYNQAVANQNALSAERDAAAKEGDIRQQVRVKVGQQLAAQGGSGFEMGTGSNMDAIAESQVNGMLDALRVRRQGATQAQVYQQQGVLAKMTADNQARQAYFGAASSLVDTAKDYAAAAG